MVRPLALFSLAIPLVAGPGAAQLIVQQQIVVRVQRQTVKPVVWREKKGPKCVPMGALAGALVLQPDAVDLVLAGGERLRARFDEDCPGLNFYGGFYLKPTRDGKLCAGRDRIRARSGAACEIDGFRKLVAKR